MRRSYRSRASAGNGPRRRVLAAVAALAAFGGLVGVTQISNAESQRTPVACEPTSPPASAGAAERDGTGGDGDAAGPDATAGAASPPASPAECEEQDGREEPAEESSGPTPGNGLNALGDNCDKSGLPAHTGFQDGGRCVSTAFGEVGAAEQNPTLLISKAPKRVTAGQPFQIVVSTRNLVRDRFLPAARGGYYAETSLLNDEGLVRGHFHTACRMLTSTTEAADPAPVPAFFVATEDGKGGDEPDLLTIQVPGLPAGLAQCAAWAGDGSHRIPMMQRANQIPALDSVRIQVEPADEEPPADQPGNEEPPADQPGGEEPPAGNPGNEEPPAGNPGGEEPPADQPGDEPAGQEPDQEDRPGNGQGSDEQQPDPAESGDGSPRPAPVANESTPAGSAADETNVVEGPPARDTNTEASGGRLALTGSNTIAFLVMGAALFIAGMALIYLTRRRRTVRRR